MKQTSLPCNQCVDAIVLAGGLGTRLRHVLPQIPKTMAPIQGVPFLKILLKQLSQYPFISKTILALGYKAESICSFISPTPFLDFSIEKTALGTGGSILNALDRTTKETLLIVNGDTFFDIDFHSLYSFHLKTNSLATIATRHETNNKGLFGSIQTNQEQRILSFKEKSKDFEEGWVSGGIYLLQKELFSSFEKGKNYSLEYDFLPSFIKNKAFAYPSSALFIDIGTPESYNQAQHLLQPWIST